MIKHANQGRLQEAHSSENIWTPANIVTLVRIAFIPVFYLLACLPWTSLMPELAEWMPYASCAFFILLSCTDSIDGYLARSRGEVTTFGKFIDPIADKILVATALLILVGQGKLASWIALIIILREFIVSGLRMLAADKGVVIPASWHGKWKTVFTMLALIAYLLIDIKVGPLSQDKLPWLLNLAQILMWIALILTIVSCLDYFMKSWRLVFKDPKGTKHIKRAKQAHNLNTELNRGLDREPDREPDEEINTKLELSAQKLVSLAKEFGIKISSAESCTGGMIASYITSVDGSSQIFETSLVSYSERIKHA